MNTNKADNQLISEVFKKKVPGPKVKVPPVLLKALSVHSKMMQVSGQGEAKPRDILGTIATAIEGTEHAPL